MNKKLISIINRPLVSATEKIIKTKTSSASLYKRTTNYCIKENKVKVAIKTFSP